MRTSVVVSVWLMVPEVSYYSKGDGHPRQICPPVLPRPPGMTLPLDGQQMSVPRAGVIARVPSD